MKWISGWIIGCVLGCQLVSAQDKSGLSLERLQQLDKNQDGKLSADELGKMLWKRLSGFDANGDRALDATELKALAEVKNREQKKMPTRPGGANAAFTIHEHQATNGQKLPYSLFVPADKPKNLPMVVCLHGAGGNTAAANLLASVELQKEHPCIVFAPACSGAGTRWVKSAFRDNPQIRAVTAELIETIDAVVKETGADPTRIYLTGQSMGGVGTWGLIAAFPEKFAAAVPVCGIWEATDGEKIAKVPVWAFHGAKDSTVPVEGSRQMIAAMKAAGGNPKYTEFPDVGHGSWDAAYSTAGLWEWMFAQRRK